MPILARGQTETQDVVGVALIHLPRSPAAKSGQRKLVSALTTAAGMCSRKSTRTASYCGRQSVSGPRRARAARERWMARADGSCARWRRICCTGIRKNANRRTPQRLELQGPGNGAGGQPGHDSSTPTGAQLLLLLACLLVRCNALGQICGACARSRSGTTSGSQPNRMQR